MLREEDRSLLNDALRGAAAGVVATWLMGRVTSYLYDRESAVARIREDVARGRKDAYVVAAEKAARLAGTELTEEEEKRYGAGIHWGLGIAAGAAYGMMRGRVPGADLSAGLAFGTLFWLLVDEGANTLLGLTPPPGAFPVQTHARGLAGHLAFGVAAETALRAADLVSA
jgi:hypothetical protein